MNLTDATEISSDDAVVLVSPRRMRIDPSHDGGATNADTSPQPLEPVDEVAADLIDDPGFVQPALLEIEEPTEAMLAAVAGENPEIREEQLQLEAAQLADHLRERLQEIDRREAMVHARVAQLESDLRTSRVWLAERHAEFETREAELLARIAELEEQAAQRGQEVETAELAADARGLEIGQREEMLRRREDDLRWLAEELQRREEELGQQRLQFDGQLAELSQSQQLWAQQRDDDQRRWADEFRRKEAELAAERSQMQQQLDQAFAEREEHIRTAEFLVNEHAEELERERAALLADQKAWQTQKADQRRAIDDLRTAAEGELADRRLRLDARQQWIERQKAGLDQVRDEALSLHRQSLEMRLIAEQVWSQITGAMGPAQATQAIAHLRLKLTDQYRLEEDQLTARRDELVQLGDRIAEQHRELSQLKNGVREWASTRQAEIEQQASTLVERELTLDAQQQELLKTRHQWDCERRAYEQQIRELTSQLRAEPAAA
jgi:hypothetical protein